MKQRSKRMPKTNDESDEAFHERTTLPMWRWNKEQEGDIHKRQYHEWRLTESKPEAWSFVCLRCKDAHELKAYQPQRIAGKPIVI